MKKFFALIMFVAVLVFNFTCAAYAPDGRLFITMLDVSQGDAFLIETPEQNILIDTGDVKTRKQLVELLHACGIERLEKIILTHAHADHIGGVRAVLNNFPVDEIADNGFKSNSPLYRDYRTADVKFSALQDGDILDLGGGVKFIVLAPNKLFRFDNVNNQSVVGKLIFGDFSMLFTADAEKQLVDLLCDRDIKATVLKAPHHGSKSSSSADFIANVKPEFVFISAGKSNKFNHPHKQSLRTYRENFILPENIFCTAFNGSVRLETDGTNKLIMPERATDWLEDYSGEIISVVRLD